VCALGLAPEGTCAIGKRPLGNQRRLLDNNGNVAVTYTGCRNVRLLEFSQRRLQRLTLVSSALNLRGLSPES
jgi:hypothetical protein